MKFIRSSVHFLFELSHRAAYRSCCQKQSRYSHTGPDRQSARSGHALRTDPARQNNGGYGLGLSIASSIVSEMNGKIWCESRSGVNSFFVQLPLFKEETKNLQMMK